MAELYGDNFKKAIVDSLPVQIPYSFFGVKTQTAYEEYTCTGAEVATDVIKMIRLPLNCKVVEVVLVSDATIGDVFVEVGTALDVNQLIVSTQLTGPAVHKMSDSAVTMDTGFMKNLGDQSVGVDTKIQYNENGRDVVLTVGVVAAAPTAGSKLKLAITYLEL